MCAKEERKEEKKVTSILTGHPRLSRPSRRNRGCPATHLRREELCRGLAAERVVEVLGLLGPQHGAVPPSRQLKPPDMASRFGNPQWGKKSAVPAHSTKMKTKMDTNSTFLSKNRYRRRYLHGGVERCVKHVFALQHHKTIRIGWATFK